MAADEDHDDGIPRPPLPPEDRLWRHPSEMRQAAPVAVAPTTASSSDRGGRRGGVGLALAGGALVAIVVVVGLELSGNIRSRVPATIEIAAVTTSSVVPTLNMLRRTVPDTEIAGVAWIDTGTGRAPVPGIVVDSDGHVVTSASALADATPATATCLGMVATSLRVVGVDRRTDIAVLATGSSEWPIARMNTIRIHPGDTVHLVTNRQSGGASMLEGEIRGVDGEGDPVIAWSGRVVDAAIAVDGSGAVVAVMGGPHQEGDAVSINDALKSARTIIDRDRTSSTTSGR